MKRKSELIEEKQELLRKLQDSEISPNEYREQVKKLDNQIKIIVDNESLGTNIRIIKYCMIVIAAVMAIFLFITIIGYIASYSSEDFYDQSYTDDYNYEIDNEL